MKSYILILAGIICILMAGCKKASCFEKAGNLTRVQRSTATFNQIDLKDNINLILTQDTAEAITIEAGTYLIPNIATTVENNILTIENKTTCNWLRQPGEKIDVYVSVKNLEKLSYNASGNVTTTNTIYTDHILIESKEGAGNLDMTLEALVITAYLSKENADFTLRGKANVCHSYTNSRGSVDFKDLEVKTMNIEYGSVRDAVFYATEEINAIIYHTGNLYYKGNPAIINKTFHSTGKLLHIP
jgi:hypothetical protein